MQACSCSARAHLQKAALKRVAAKLQKALTVACHTERVPISLDVEMGRSLASCKGLAYSIRADQEGQRVSAECVSCGTSLRRASLPVPAVRRARLVAYVRSLRREHDDGHVTMRMVPEMRSGEAEGSSGSGGKGGAKVVGIKGGAGASKGGVQEVGALDTAALVRRLRFGEDNARAAVRRCARGRFHPEALCSGCGTRNCPGYCGEAREARGHRAMRRVLRDGRGAHGEHHHVAAARLVRRRSPNRLRPAVDPLFFITVASPDLP